MAPKWQHRLLWMASVLPSAVLAEQPQQILSGGSSPLSRLNFSSPSPLIFHSTFGLLQQWPNTFFPNGHTVAPCSIAKNINLYHARTDMDPPPSPEWFAFDPEMAYAIAGSSDSSQLLTYRTTKTVKCLYFDGTSASLVSGGSMDAQMVVLHNDSAHVPDQPAFGRPPNRNDSHGTPICGPGRDSGEDCTHWNPLQAEYDRAEGLCNFIHEKGLGGLGWGYEGIVRTNAAFELIWCNFSSPSARLVSQLDVAVSPIEGTGNSYDPRRPRVLDTPMGLSGADEPAELARNNTPSGDWRNRLTPWSHPFMNHSMYEWFDVAARRYGFAGGVPGRGEARATVDSCGIFSFYDPALVHQEQSRIHQEMQLYNLSAEGHWLGAAEPDRADALLALTRRRRDQRVQNVSTADGMYMRVAVEQRLKTMLHSQVPECSGIDWLLVAQEVVTFYSGPLYDITTALIRLTDTGSSSYEAVRGGLAHLRELAHRIWFMYYEYRSSSEIDINEPFNMDSPRFRAALERCSSQYEPFGDDGLSDSERTTYTAVSEVLSAICTRTLPVLSDTERLWMAYFNNASAVADSASPAYQEVLQLAEKHSEVLQELMAWLGWADQWTACSPGCGLGQVCYIPIWPALGSVRFGGPPRRGNDNNNTGPPHRGGGFGMDGWSEYLWKPHCVDDEHFPESGSG